MIRKIFINGNKRFIIFTERIADLVWSAAFAPDTNIYIILNNLIISVNTHYHVIKETELLVNIALEEKDAEIQKATEARLEEGGNLN